MKLRNKKTGEIGKPRLEYNEVYIDTENHMTYCYKTLDGVIKEWEDYEEPKEYWCIEYCGEVSKESDDGMEVDEACKEIGNYFKTEKEAEQAVERLKAWKRLKDKGFRFDGYGVAHNSNSDLCGQLFYNAGNYCIEDVEKDLDLLFGGEE